MEGGIPSQSQGEGNTAWEAFAGIVQKYAGPFQNRFRAKGNARKIITYERSFAEGSRPQPPYREPAIGSRRRPYRLNESRNASLTVCFMMPSYSGPRNFFKRSVLMMYCPVM
jgi:hypothetical protein